MNILLDIIIYGCLGLLAVGVIGAWIIIGVFAFNWLKNMFEEAIK